MARIRYLSICFAQTYFAYYSNRNAFVTSIYLPIDGAQNPRNSSLKQWSGSSHVNHQSWILNSKSRKLFSFAFLEANIIVILQKKIQFVAP